ncbi:MAG: ATP-binding protein [Treponema sp.]|nr:ATP-binding protein [Treponema sp.]
MKIGFKLAIAIAGFSLLVLGSVGITMFTQARSNILGSFYAEAMATANEYAELFGGFLSQKWHVAQTAARMLEQYGSMAADSRRPFINRALEGIVTGNPDILAVWTMWELDALEGNDALRTGTEGAGAGGRFAPYWYSVAGEARLRVLDEFGLPGLHYPAARMSVPGAIRDPSFVYVADKQLLVATITATIHSGPRVVGVVGVDFSTERMQEMVEGFYPFGDGITKVFSNNGTVVAHHRYSRNLGTSIFDTEWDMAGPYMARLGRAVSMGEELDFRHFHPGFQELMNMFIAPIKIGAAVTPWSLAIAIPRRTVAASMRPMEITALVLSLVIVALIIPAAIFMSKSLTKPVMTVMDAFQDVAAMKDSLKIGIFFMDKDYIIQDNYSRYLEDLLADTNLKGKRFTDILAASIAPDKMEFIVSYLDMVINRAHDPETLLEINPLNEVQYTDPSGAKKIFHCEPISVELGKDESITMVTIHDITANMELQEQLKKEEKKRHGEMRNLFELLQMEPLAFESFREYMEQEFASMDEIMGNSNLSSNEILTKVYDSIVAMKSKALELGLLNFGARVQEVEEEITKLKDREGEIHFDDMLHLTIEVERLAKEKDSFKQILDRMRAFKVGEEKAASSDKAFLAELLGKIAADTAADMDRKVRFVASDVDPKAVEDGPRRTIKEVLMQLVRNSVVHGVEPPDERIANGKNETGTISLSIKNSGGNIHVKLTDDGRGLDFDRIRERAVRLNLIKEDEATNKGRLLNAIFSLGFSTMGDGQSGQFRGVGLSLVRDRVRDASGTIKLQTEPGKGTVFNIFFPVGNGAMDKAS